MNFEEMKQGLRQAESSIEQEHRLYAEWQKEIADRDFKYQRLTGTCEECIYFTENSPHRREREGECRRYPPMHCAEYLDHKPFYFPDVCSDDRCGEFKEAKKIKKR